MKETDPSWIDVLGRLMRVNGLAKEDRSGRCRRILERVLCIMLILAESEDAKEAIRKNAKARVTIEQV